MVSEIETFHELERAADQLAEDLWDALLVVLLAGGGIAALYGLALLLLE